MDYVSILVKMLGYQRPSNSHTRAFVSVEVMACSLQGIPWKSSTIGQWSRLECLNCVICVENNNRVHWSILLFGFSVRVLLMLFLFLCLSVDLHMFDNLCVGVSEKEKIELIIDIILDFVLMWILSGLIGAYTRSRCLFWICNDLSMWE